MQIINRGDGETQTAEEEGPIPIPRADLKDRAFLGDERYQRQSFIRRAQAAEMVHQNREDGMTVFDFLHRGSGTAPLQAVARPGPEIVVRVYMGLGPGEGEG